MKTPVSVLALLTKLFRNANLEHSISCRFPFYLLMSLVIGHFWLFISYDALNMKDLLPRFVKISLNEKEESFRDVKIYVEWWKHCRGSNQWSIPWFSYFSERFVVRFQCNAHWVSFFNFIFLIIFCSEKGDSKIWTKENPIFCHKVKDNRTAIIWEWTYGRHPLTATFGGV